MYIYILTIAQLDITLEFHFIYWLYKCLYFGLCVYACDYIDGYCGCMCRRGQVELPPFDTEPERTLHHLCRELREAQ